MQSRGVISLAIFGRTLDALSIGFIAAIVAATNHFELSVLPTSEAIMKAASLIQSILFTLCFGQLSFAQGGPYLVDHLWPHAWPNAKITAYPSTEAALAAGETIYVPNTVVLAQKQKDYYVYFDSSKANGFAHRQQIDNNSCRVWLEWNGYYYPSNGGYDCEYDAIPFDQLDPKCFAPLQGPYCDIPNGVTYVGQINGFPWVAFSGFYRKMGAPFTTTQIEKILGRNEDHNSGELRSDLRAALVNEFLDSFPEFAGEIPIDSEGDQLTTAAGSDNTAVVCHIIPAIAPDGNGAGRNAYGNAMVISQDLKEKLVDVQTGIGVMPSDAMLLYFGWLAEYNDVKSSAAAESKFTATYIRDPRALGGIEVEYLSQDETRVAMVHAGLIRPSAPEGSRK